MQNTMLSDMQVISTKTHGMLDYTTSAALMAAPLLLDMDGGAATWVPTLLGGSTTLASLMTDYELGVIPMISMETHLMLDIGSGIFLAASPFLFGSYKKGIKNWLPHVLVGLMEVCVALMTDPSTNTEDPMSGRDLEDSSIRIRRMSESFAS